MRISISYLPIVYPLMIMTEKIPSTFSPETIENDIAHFIEMAAYDYCENIDVVTGILSCESNLSYDIFIGICKSDETCIQIVTAYFADVKKYESESVYIRSSRVFRYSPCIFFEIVCKSKLSILFHSIRRRLVRQPLLHLYI